MTSPPMSNSTRNCVLASASLTRPSTSIDSSLAIGNINLLSLNRQEPGPRWAGSCDSPGIHCIGLVPAAAAAIPAAAAAPPATIPAAAATASATAATEPATLARFARPSLVHRQGPALEVEVVQGLNGRFGLGLVGHLDEPEAARPPGLSVQDDLGPGHGPVLAEQLHQVVVRAPPREV